MDLLGTRAVFALIVSATIASYSVNSDADPADLKFPAPNPPSKFIEPKDIPSKRPAPVAPTESTMLEWTNHKTADGMHPSAAEQKMMWLMNRARQNPTVEGLFLAESADPDIADGRSFFGVDLSRLKSDFASLSARPPAAFDSRLYEASKDHSNDLIARDTQDHSGQINRVDARDFSWSAISVSVFSFAESALNAHAALNIDWGGSAATGGVQDPPGHRNAIMGQFESGGGNVLLTNVGLALVPDGSAATNVGPLVFSGVYCHGLSDEENRFIVGTVWNDLNENSQYDEGEGLGGVTVRPDAGQFFAVSGDAGGYAIPITAAASYTVSFSGGGLGTATVDRQVVVGSESVLMDLNYGTDNDGDGVADNIDNCPGMNNPNQRDTDRDSIGNICDDDDDGDGILDTNDAFPLNAAEDADLDGDGMGDNYEVSNNFDVNSASDAGEDADNDGFTNLTEFQDKTDPRDSSDPSNRSSLLLRIISAQKALAQ